MSKVKIISIIDNKNNNQLVKKEINGIKNINSITYIDDHELVNIKLGNDIIMKRNDNIFNFSLNKNTLCIYKIYNRELKLNIFTNNIKIEENYLEIDYTIEEEKINFKLYIK